MTPRTSASEKPHEIRPKPEDDLRARRDAINALAKARASGVEKDLIAEAKAANAFAEAAAPIYLALGQQPPPTSPVERLLWDAAARKMANDTVVVTARGARRPPMSDSAWNAKEYANTADRVAGLLPAAGFALIAAETKRGKSLLGLQLSLCIATGVPFMERATVQCPVMYIDEEGAAYKHRDRKFRQMSGLGLHGDLPDVYWRIREGVRIDDPSWLADLEDDIRDYGLKVVILGPLAQLAVLRDESSSAEMGKVTRVLNRLSADHDILVILIHHSKKPSINDGTGISAALNSSRGSSALPGAVDTAIIIDRKLEELTGRLIVIERDGKVFIEHYRLDEASLTVSPIPEPDTRKAPPDEVYLTIAESDGVTKRALASRHGCSEDTMESRLAELEAAGRIYMRQPKHNDPKQWYATSALTTLGLSDGVPEAAERPLLN